MCKWALSSLGNTSDYTAYSALWEGANHQPVEVTRRMHQSEHKIRKIAGEERKSSSFTSRIIDFPNCPWPSMKQTMFCSLWRGQTGPYGGARQHERCEDAVGYVGSNFIGIFSLISSDFPVFLFFFVIFATLSLLSGCIFFPTANTAHHTVVFIARQRRNPFQFRILPLGSLPPLDPTLPTIVHELQCAHSEEEEEKEEEKRKKKKERQKKKCTKKVAHHHTTGDRRVFELVRK